MCRRSLLHIAHGPQRDMAKDLCVDAKHPRSPAICRTRSRCAGACRLRCRGQGTADCELLQHRHRSERSLHHRPARRDHHPRVAQPRTQRRQGTRAPRWAADDPAGAGHPGGRQDRDRTEIYRTADRLGDRQHARRQLHAAGSDHRRDRAAGFAAVPRQYDRARCNDCGGRAQRICRRQPRQADPA